MHRAIRQPCMHIADNRMALGLPRRLSACRRAPGLCPAAVVSGRSRAESHRTSRTPEIDVWWGSTSESGPPMVSDARDAMCSALLVVPVALFCSIEYAYAVRTRARHDGC